MTIWKSGPIHRVSEYNDSRDYTRRIGLQDRWTNETVSLPQFSLVTVRELGETQAFEDGLTGGHKVDDQLECVIQRVTLELLERVQNCQLLCATIEQVQVEQAAGYPLFAGLSETANFGRSAAIISFLVTMKSMTS